MFNLDRESNLEPLTFQTKIQTITQFRFKYQDNLKSVLVLKSELCNGLRAFLECKRFRARFPGHVTKVS